MQLECGKFTGNGTSLDITLKTKRIPDLLFVKIDSGRYGRYKHILQASDISTRFNNATSDSTGVTALYEGGFSVGNNTDVNQNTIETGYVAFFDDDNGDFEVGTYTGDGNTTQVISIEQGFDAEIGFVFDDSGNSFFRSSADSNARGFTNSGAQTTHITAIGTGTFTVGSSLNVSSIKYYYAVFKKVVGKNGSGTYSGSASGQTINFSDASSGVAEYMIISNQSTGRTQPVRADKDYLFNDPDETHSYFTEAWGAYNEILEFNRGSFSVGTSRDANWLGDTYAYFWLSSNPKTETALPVAVPQQNAVNTNPDFIDLSNPSTNHGLNDGLVLHVRFLPRLFNDESYPDFSPYKNDLTLLNVTDDLVIDFENGRWGYLNCNGSSGQSGYCPLSDSLELTELTFAGWVRVENDGILSILEKRQGTTSAWCIYSNDRAINIAGSNRGNNVAVTSVLAGSVWYYIAVTLDSSGNAKGYVNGTLSLSSTTDAPGSQPTFPVILGARWDDIGTLTLMRRFEGKLDGIRLYNRVLSANEIADLYRQELAFNPDTIVRFNPISLLSYSQDVGPFASVPSVGLVNQNPDFIDLSNPIAQHGLNDGLVSWWLAIPNQMGTTIWKDLCGRNDGTLTNMDPETDWLVENEDGRWGSLDFDGSNDFVNLSTGIDLTTLSFSCWVKRESSTGTFTLFAKRDGTTHGFHIFLWNPNYRVTVIDGSGTLLADGSSTTIPINTWKHIVVTWTGSSINIYVDGEFDTSFTGSITSRPSLDMLIGARYDTAPAVNSLLNGKINDCRVYNRALSSTEVQELYNESRTYYPNLLNRIPALPFTYSFNLTPPVVVPWQGNVANQNPDFIDLSNPIANHGLNDGLVSWWLAIPNQMGTNAWVDLVGNNDGTLTNMDPGTDWLVENEDGKWGSLDFDGSNDFVEFNPVGIFDGSKNWTVSIWVNPSALLGNGMIWHPRAERDIYIRLANTAGIPIQFAFFDTGTRGISTVNPVVGTWYHCVMVWNATNSLFYAYVNSIAYGSLATGTPAVRSDKNTIGAQYFSGVPNNEFGGKINDYRLYNRALSATEVQELYNESRIYYPNLLNRIPSLLPVAVSEAASGAYSLTVDSQSITVTGTDASLLYDRILSVESGSFTLTGTAVTLNKGFTLVVDSQAITVTGTDAGVFYNRSLSVDNQSITVTGTDASTLFNRNLSVDSQAITVTGTNASTFYNRVISGESGSVTLSGTAATLTVSGVGNYSITADGKAIALSPTDASLLFNRQISVDTIEITITGTDASVFHNRVINSDSGTVTLTGQDSSLLFDRVLSVDSDSLTITGTDAGVFYNRSLSADGGSFTVSASDTSLLYDRILSADSQAVTVVGAIAALQYSEDIGVYVYAASIAIAKIGSASIGLSSSHDVSITVD